MQAPHSLDNEPTGHPVANSSLWVYLALFAPLFLLHAYAHFVFPAYYDDAFIGFRISKQMALGHGLVFNQGEGVLTNTSFLYPALNGVYFYLFGSWGLHAAILTDIACHVVALALLAVLAERSAPYLRQKYGLYLTAGITALLYLVSAKVGHGVICGMETQLYVLFITLVFYTHTLGKVPLSFWLAALVF